MDRQFSNTINPIRMPFLFRHSFGFQKLQLFLSEFISSLPIRNILLGQALAVIIAFTGVMSIASGAIFAASSEVGPVTTAFWRLALAAPICTVLFATSSPTRMTSVVPVNIKLLFLAGMCFAGVLSFWYCAQIMSSVANASLLHNLAPLILIIAITLFYRRIPSRRCALGLMFAMTGGTMLFGDSIIMGGDKMVGDFFGIASAVCYAAYFSLMARAGAGMPTAVRIMWVSTIGAACLLPLALTVENQFLPIKIDGWVNLIAIAILGQVFGQALLSMSLDHLAPFAVSAIALMEPALTVLLAWGLLAQKLSILQAAGIITTMVGVGICQYAREARRSS